MILQTALHTNIFLCVVNYVNTLTKVEGTASYFNSVIVFELNDTYNNVNQQSIPL